MSTPRVLILTASFGDGHNSAARGLAEGLRREAGERVRVDVEELDPQKINMLLAHPVG